MTSIDLEASVKEALGAWPHLDEGQLRRDFAADEPCPSHPARPSTACVPCHAARIRTGEERDVAERRTAVETNLDQRLPGRFRCATTNNSVVLDWSRGFLANPVTAGNLILGGPTSSGKTHQAAGAVRHVIPASVKMTGNPRSGARYVTTSTWAWWNVAALATALRPGGNVDPQKVLSECCAVDLLVLDDLGTARVSEWVEENLYVIINSRYEDMRPVVITTNLTGEQYQKTLGDRLASRLGQGATRVILKGHDYRANPVTPPTICPAHGIDHRGGR